jgi:NAD-dependent dihydropyrimidine dehydrogenase PreA subunit
MTYVIASPCVDVLDRSCVEVCPVDCIYEGGRKLYIQPDECIDCGACEPVCPVTAISYVDYVSDAGRAFVEDNRSFFYTILPGRDEPIGMPGGTRDIGPVDSDTPTVSAIPRN